MLGGGSRRVRRAMIFAKAKTEAACMMHAASAGQGSPVSLASLGGTRDIKPRRKLRLAIRPNGWTSWCGCRDLFSRQSAIGFPWLEA